MDKEDIVKKDERFKKVLDDPRYRAYKPVQENVELDKRFEKVLSQKRFALDDDLFHREESSSSDESSSDDELDQEDADSLDQWEEEEKACYKEDCEETNRIAICNLDWDRITSTDLFVLLNSFKTPDGCIKYVRVYPSEFGKQRLAEERIKGPKELVDQSEDQIAEIEKSEKRKKVIGSKKFGNCDDDEEFNKNGFMKDKLRKYQINRLRYYYAVVEFDSIATAVSVYEQLDGFEYLNSSVNLDLRFIPNDMQFDDDEPVNECTALPDLHFYKAPEFINTALQQTKVRLTWEENNHDMSKKLIKAFEDIDNNKEVDYLDEYLASSTENEEDSLPECDSDASDDETKESKIEKYKNLLKNIEEEEERAEKEKKKFDIEIDWAPEIDKNHRFADDSDDDEYELDDDEKQAKLKQEQRNKYRKSKKYKNTDKGESSNQMNSELELIAMDDTKKEKKHFNYENYVENSKKVNKDKKKVKVSKDEFEFDSEDPRFKAIYDSPLYNIDPSNPKFKRTKAMSQVIHKKIRKH